LDLYRTKKAIAAVPVLKRFPRNKEGTLSAAGMPRNVSVNHPDAQHVGDIQSLSPKRTIRRRIWATMEAAMRKNLKLASVFVAAILIYGMRQYQRELPVDRTFSLTPRCRRRPHRGCTG